MKEKFRLMIARIDGIQTMRHSQALKIVNKFMDDTGIRKYCQTICQGKCCSECQKPTDCSNKLPCSAFICENLIKRILEIDDTIDLCLGQLIRRSTDIANYYVLKLKITEPYFNLDTNQISDNRRVPSVSIFKTFTRNEMSLIRVRISNLIENQTQVVLSEKYNHERR